MIKLIRSNQKKFLTGLTIVAMITFVVNFGSNGTKNEADPVYGTFAGKSVNLSEVKNARAELKAVRDVIDFTPTGQHTPAYYHAASLFRALESKPEEFFMLRHEADAAHIPVSDEDVQSAMALHTGGLNPDSDEYVAAKAGIFDLLKIWGRFEQIESAVKISKPQMEHEMAVENETLKLNVIQLTAAENVMKVPAPTTQQIQEQFTKYADVAPRHPLPTTNPFGFGYQLPVRSKLQYLWILPDTVAVSVIGNPKAAYALLGQLDPKIDYSKENLDYLWDVLGQLEFQKDPTKYPLPPVIGPTSQPAATPTYEQVRIRVLADIREKVAADQMKKIKQFANATMDKDWQAYSRFCAEGKGTEPISSLGVPYSSPEYFVVLAGSLKTQFGISVLPKSTPDYMSTAKIGDLPGVGIGNSKLTSFIDSQAAEYLDKLEKKDPSAPAALLRPAPIAVDEQTPDSKITSTVICRLTGVLAKQAPADPSQVQPPGQVLTDLRTEASYKLAKDEAELLVTTAKNRNLAAAAIGSGHAMFPIDVSYTSNEIKGIMPPLENSSFTFIKKAFEMMNTYDAAKNPMPVQTIELPEQGRIFVAQLSTIEATWGAYNYYKKALEQTSDLSSEPTRALASQWLLDKASIENRLNFLDSKGNKN